MVVVVVESKKCRAGFLARYKIQDITWNIFGSIIRRQVVERNMRDGQLETGEINEVAEASRFE